ncbi:MAG: alanyl-tRNA editing protein [Candidatus Krumholzibacteria bacterium]|nr:alanyl-tRNA editing protein [Candidatus Krumholzibacteria bacterium]MDH4336554.1 alanyl-tRNA editing protein [Candidatus Krumholzibacteria bacterium]MDH5269635.1 alanyl-tRNA editing protein [Candidatus Krumholzibacteria bacterium]MDH5627286.1 alanyl-tRNA editing protein [Candidatus Krumholzibacteria bacterium]
MTQKLYLDQTYDTVFEAAVASSRPLEDGASEVVLDRTLFYPESGGQLPDGGTLGDAVVANVQERDDAVVHTVQGTLRAGQRIAGAIDWGRRFDHMQQHTGQHVLSRAFIQAAGLHTVSFHMGEETCTIDLEGTGFDEDAVRKAEDVANHVIEENRPVDITTMPLAELDRLDLRRKVPEGVSEARIVAVRDFDLIPCCGTHVRNTGELGLVKVLKGEKVKGLQRVHFKVGLRALDDYREKHAIVQALANRLTTGPAEVLTRIERIMDDAQAGARRAKFLTERLAGAEMARLLDGAARAGGVRVLLHRDADPAYVRALATVLQGEAKVVAILGADDGAVLCVASRDLAIDLASGAADIARELGGSGGGKGGFVQLKLPDDSRLQELMQRMEAHVRTRLS